MRHQNIAHEDIAFRRFQTDLVLAFHGVHHQIQRRSAVLLSEAGLPNITPSGAMALIVLFNARGSINARELAYQLEVSEVTVSRLLRKLEDDGWIERIPDPSDGRAMQLCVTTMARKMLPSLVDVSNEILDEVFGTVDKDDLVYLSGLVQKIQGSLKAHFDTVLPGTVAK